MRLVLLCAVCWAMPSWADFTLVSEAMLDGQRQVTTVSLRGKMLRISIRRGKEETLFLRDTEAGRTRFKSPGEKARIVTDVSDKTGAPQTVVGYAFEPQNKKGKRVGISCDEFIARHELPLMTFASCYAPWSTLGFESAADFARLFPPLNTTMVVPLLSLMTLTWVGLHPSFAAYLPGIPLQRSGLPKNGRPSALTTHVTKLTHTALDAALFEFP